MEAVDDRPIEGSLEAPVIYFEGAPLLGSIIGVGRIALEAVVQERLADGTIIGRRKVVAHLRGNAIAFASLRSAIEQMEMAAAGPKPGDVVN